MDSKCIRCTNKPDPSTGYGRSTKNGILTYEHRIAFANANPRIDITGLIVHHECQHPWCVNPKHLKAKTRKEHSAEHGLSGWAKIHAEKKVAKCGHPFDSTTGKQRVCSPCMREYKKKWATDHYDIKKDHINKLKRERRKLNKLT